MQGLAWCGKEVDRQMRIAAYLRDRIKERTGFQLVVEVYTFIMLYSYFILSLHIFRENSTLMCVSGTFLHV